MSNPSPSPLREYAVAPNAGLVGAAVLLLLPALAEIGGGPAWMLPVAFAGILAGAGVDLLRGWRAPRVLRCTVSSRIRCRLHREVAVSASVEDTAGRIGSVRIGIPLADSFAVEGKEKGLRLPRDGGPVTVSWPCVPSRRGSYRIAALYVEVASPWRLWKIRVAVPVEMEIRVYPDLAMERSALAAVFLRRSLPGAVPWRQVGRGREFDKLREYQPGDAFDEIHWKATAKRNEPITKVFRVEQTQEVYVVIDASRLSGRRLRTPYADTDESAASLLERQVTAALALGAAAENQGDHFGLIAFSDRVRRFVRAKGGKATYQACREALLDLRPGEVSPDFHEVSAFVRSRLTRRALLVYLTYLDDPVVSEAFIHSIAPVLERHVVRVCMIRPSGVRPLFAGGVLQQDGELFERISGHVYWRHLDEAAKILRRKGAPFTLVEEEKTAAHLISQYMRVKQRQLL